MQTTSRDRAVDRPVDRPAVVRREINLRVPISGIEPTRVVQSRKILAVASGGGHWVQLMRLVPAFKGHDIAFVTVKPSYRSDIGEARFYAIEDATRWNKFGLVKMGFKLAKIIYRERPDIIITTGAAPGYLALLIGKLLGRHRQTIWIDSIANVERLSMCGQWVGRHADLWLTQWPNLARPSGPHYIGAII